MLIFVVVAFFLLAGINQVQSIVSHILPSVSIHEESPLSTVVVDLRPILQTWQVQPSQAVLLHSQSSQPFEYSHGLIRLKSRLDREDYVRKRLCLGGNVYQCNFTLTLTVNRNETPFNYILSQPISCRDINDHSPKFSQSEAKISLAENLPIGHRIPLEVAIDLDSPPYGIDTYRLESAERARTSAFSLIYDHQSRELELSIEEKLDREEMEVYHLELVALDHGQPPHQARQKLIIEISDINDSPPRFSASIYNVSVAENSLPESLLQLRATDADTGVHAQMIYQLTDDHQGLFHLDPKSGILTLTRALDYELKQTYHLRANVFDSEVNPFTDSTEIFINVIDQNDHAPSIQMKFNPLIEQNPEGTMVYLNESFDIQTAIAWIELTDEDSGENGRAELTVEPHRYFRLDQLEKPRSYALKSSRPFDRESIAFHQIELRARDFGHPSHRRSMRFDLNVTDVNDQRPFFTENYTFAVPENNRVPMQLGQIHAFDQDEGENGRLTYTLINSTTEFYLSPHDGILWANISFDYEKKKFYRLMVKAMDHGQPPFDTLTSIDIRIENVNEYAPMFEQEIYRFSIEENSTNAEQRRKRVVGQVRAIDRDRDDRIRYSIHPDGETLFQIDDQGRISTEKIFDREVQDEYRFRVIAKDNSSISSSCTVIVEIKDINDNPPVIRWPKTDEFRHVLTSNPSQTQFISEILIDDEDLGNNSIAQLTLNNNDLFFIGPNASLWLRNSSMAPGVYPLEVHVKNGRYETSKSIRLVILARDHRSFSDEWWKSLEHFIPSLPQVMIILLTSCASLTITFLLIYYRCFRSNVRQRLYGSRLIVNDDEKCSTTMNSPNSRHKQRKNSPCISSNNQFPANGQIYTAPTKNVTFTSTFSTLPKSQTVSKEEHCHTLPKSPPSLHGIVLLEKSLDENTGWYSLTSNYPTRASVV